MAKNGNSDWGARRFFFEEGSPGSKMARLGAVRARGRCGALSAERASTNTSALGTTPTPVPGKRLVDALGRPTHAPFQVIFAAWRPPLCSAAAAKMAWEGA